MRWTCCCTRKSCFYTIVALDYLYSSTATSIAGETCAFVIVCSLRSELNFPVGVKSRLEPWDMRWGMTIALLEPFFVDSAGAGGHLRAFHATLEDGKRQKYVQANAFKTYQQQSHRKGRPTMHKQTRN